MHNAIDNYLCEASPDTGVFDPASQRGSILLPGKYLVYPLLLKTGSLDNAIREFSLA